MDNEKRKHGGFRPGAGRKAVENKRVQVTATVERDTRDTIKDYCKTKQTRLGRLLDTMVEQEYFMTVKEFKEDLQNSIRKALDYAERNWTNYDQVLGANMLAEFIFKHISNDEGKRTD